MIDIIVNQIRTMMNSTLSEFIGEKCDVNTIEYARHLMYSRFCDQFVNTRKVSNGKLNVDIIKEGNVGARYMLDVEFGYPYNRKERIISGMYR